MHEIDLHRIDLNLLVTFEVLMGEGSVTRAAQRLGRTQSAVSHALARLRDQLDGCIGCGCLSLRDCPLRNPGDVLAAEGPGARLLDL